jgi:hypothetical protein
MRTPATHSPRAGAAAAIVLLSGAVSQAQKDVARRTE